MRHSHRFSLAAALALSAAACSNDAANGSVELRSGSLSTETAVSVNDESLVDHFVVRTTAADRPKLKRALRARGARIDAALTSDAYLVTAPRAALDVPGVEFALKLPSALKIAPGLTRGTTLGGAVPRSRTVVAHLFLDADTQPLLARLRARDYPVSALARGPRFARLVIRTTQAKLGELVDMLADHDDVFWIGERGRRELFNGTSVGVGQSGPSGGGATPIFDHGILGQGQIAAVLDSGLDVDMCFFRDDAGLPAINDSEGTSVDTTRRKVIAYDFWYEADSADDVESWDDHGHGTHVAGSVAGDGGEVGTHDGNDGMAPLAQLVIQDGGSYPGGGDDDCSDMPALGCPLADLAPVFEQAYAQGARVHSDSWGDRENFDPHNTYSDASEDVDTFMWTHRDFLVVAAAGNDGSAGSVASPSTAKNCVSVGATLRATNAHTLAGFSSRGPTDDGRLKPDVTFPGADIASASSDLDITTDNCETVSFSGTSMSAPGVAGLALLVRQYYVDGFYPSGVETVADTLAPSAALVKATLINSAQAMTSEDAVPSFDQGWGRVELGKSLAFADGDFELFARDEAAGFESATDSGESIELDVTDTDYPLKITLVWTDYPSNPAAVTHLVNDLDLRVTNSAGAYLGNVMEEGESVTGGSADRLNNVEQVLLSNPPLGVHSIVISPNTIAMGPQPFALVVTGRFELATTDPPDAGTGGTGGVDTGTGGTSTGGSGGAGVGGAGAVGGTAGSAGNGGTTSGDASAESSGCACTLPRSAPRSVFGGLLALFVLGATRRLRRS